MRKTLAPQEAGLEAENGVQQLSREMYLIPLIKAIQELSATKIEALTTRITALEG
jgi:hypothetical protein